MAGAGPVSGLGDAATDYLAFRRAFGQKLTSHQRLLTELVAYLDASGTGTVTVNTAIAWAAAPAGRSPRRVADRLSVARKFAQYLAAFDPATEVPPAHLLRVGTTRPTPYIFSAEEVHALMSAADRLAPPLLAASFATLIGLMNATGLRTMEAGRLDAADLTLDGPEGGRLLVRRTKYGKTRQLPLHPSTTAALAEYAAHRAQLCPDPTQVAFFLGPDGQRLTHLGVTFARLLREVGIRVPPGRRRPRLHDLRHTFAVNTLRDWHAAGLDAQRQLPALSTYLGHANPASTYWYLQAVPELMTVLADRLDDAPQDRS